MKKEGETSFFLVKTQRNKEFNSKISKLSLTAEIASPFNSYFVLMVRLTSEYLRKLSKFYKNQQLNC